MVAPNKFTWIKEYRKSTICELREAIDAYHKLFGKQHQFVITFNDKDHNLKLLYEKVRAVVPATIEIVVHD